MPNTKSKTYSGFIDIPTIPPGAVDQIIDVTEIQFDNCERKYLEKISIDYLVDRELVDKLPRLSENKAAIKKILPKATNLLNALENMDSTTFRIVADHMYEISKTGDLLSTIEAIRGLVFSFENSLSIIQRDKGGRTKSTAALIRYVIELTLLFSDATGLQPTASAPNPDNFSKGSPFFHFVDACLNALKCPAGTDFALQHAIQQALSQ